MTDKSGVFEFKMNDGEISETLQRVEYFVDVFWRSFGKIQGCEVKSQEFDRFELFQMGDVQVA